MMRRSALFSLLGALLAGCASESATAPNSTQRFNDLSFSSVKWSVKNLLVTENSRGSSQFVGQDPKTYDNTRELVISTADSLGTLVGHDPHYSIIGNRAPMDSLSVVIDQERSVLTLRYTYARSENSSGGGSSTSLNSGVALNDLPFVLEADSSITVQLSGTEAASHITYSQYESFDSGDAMQAYHSSGTRSQSGPTVATDSLSISVRLNK